MNKLLKVIFGIVFTFLFAFTGIGYAQLTQEMKIKGFMGLSELKAIYIASIFLYVHKIKWGAKFFIQAFK